MKLLQHLSQLLHSEELQQLRELNEEWLQEVRRLQNELQVCEIHQQQLVCSIDEMKQEKEIRDSQYLRMKDKFEKYESVREYYEAIGFPETALKDIEQNLKNADKYTIRVIQEYLKTDNQELIKNLAQTMNVGNQAMVIAYKDWAIWRNEALIKKLETLKADSFHDKLTGETRIIGKKNKEES